MEMVLAGSLATWIIIGAALLAGWPLAQRFRHERHRPFAAYLLFMSVAALVAAALFLAIMFAAEAAGLMHLLSGGLAATVVIVAILAVAILLGRHVVRRPPGQRMPR